MLWLMLNTISLRRFLDLVPGEKGLEGLCMTTGFTISHFKRKPGTQSKPHTPDHCSTPKRPAQEDTPPSARGNNPALDKAG